MNSSKPSKNRRTQNSKSKKEFRLSKKMKKRKSLLKKNQKWLRMQQASWKNQKLRKRMLKSFMHIEFNKADVPETTATKVVGTESIELSRALIAADLCVIEIMDA